MAENRRERDKRFYYSRGQMFLLGGAFTLASITIFLLGIYVGKSIEARKVVKPDEPLLKFPVNPPAQAPGAAPSGQGADEQAVFENQTKVVAGAQPLVEENPKPAKSAEPAVKTEAVKDSKAPVKDTVPQKVVEKKAEKAPAEPTTTAAAEGDAKDSSKNWRVQVNAYPDELSAKQLVDRLKNKSYNAYVTEAQNKGKTWYRVSVGKYGSREEADKMLEILKAKENFTKAFAATK
jgi:cell division septation protein DedD